MRVFLTGGTGFIGTAVCAALRDHDLLVLSRQPAQHRLPGSGRFVQGDLADASSWESRLRAFCPDVCLHLAWSGLPDHSPATSAANFQAGLGLLRCLADIRCPRVVATGSCAEYGNLAGCVTEDLVPPEYDVFAAFKTAQRLFGEKLFAAAGTEFLWARPFFVYGPGQRPESLIPSLLKDLGEKRPARIRTPDAVHDFVHVDDVAGGLVALATSRAQPGVYNLGSGQPAQVSEVANLVAQSLNRPEVFPRAGKADSHGGSSGPRPAGGFWANLDRIRQQAGWQPLKSLEVGLGQTIACWNGEQPCSSILG